ncbi:MAG TPA: energy transducer TonB [Steroidobacteraceae bacterium]|nr:energy transducer TonB [Steroidobacteraceae bacterium]
MRTLTLACALGLLCSQLGAAQVVSWDQLPTGTAQPVTLDHIDRTLEYIRSLPWTLSEALGDPGPTPDGSTLDNDIDRYLLTEPVLQEMEALRRDLPAAIPPGSDKVPVSAQGPLDHVVRTESCRASMLRSAWSSRRAVEYHLQMIAPLLAELPESGQDEWRDRVRAIDAWEAAVHGKLPAAMKDCDDRSLDRLPPLLQDIMALHTEANQLRGNLAAAIEALPANTSTEPEWMTRTRTCPVGSGATTGTPYPRLISRPDSWDYYPPDASMFRVEGRVGVIVDIDATGCVTRTAIAQSTGAPELDRAGMLMALDMQFVPGDVEGKVLAGRFIQGIVFSAPMLGFAPVSLKSIYTGNTQPQP